MADVKPWTDEEIERERTTIQMRIVESPNDPEFVTWASHADATLRELLDLRAKVTRLTHENQSARAERDLVWEHLADVNKEIYQMRMKAAKAAKGGAK